MLSGDCGGPNSGSFGALGGESYPSVEAREHTAYNIQVEGTTKTNFTKAKAHNREQISQIAFRFCSRLHEFSKSGGGFSIKNSKNKMCETTTHRPVFKGVVVCTVTILMAACMICPSSVSGRNLPYCVYVDRIQEIKCGCENFALNTTFPNSDIFVSLPASSIERQDAKKIKGFTLDTCDKLHLKLDLTPLPQPFLRWRIQNVKEVIIESIVVRPNDSVNFWFDHITNNLTLKGTAV